MHNMVPFLISRHNYASRHSELRLHWKPTIPRKRVLALVKPLDVGSSQTIKVDAKVHSSESLLLPLHIKQ